MVKVFNLYTGEFVGTWFLSPIGAVVAAYAQSKGDFNTWDYEEKYRSLIKMGTVSVTCGDFSALLFDPPLQYKVDELIKAGKAVDIHRHRRGTNHAM